MPNHPTSKLAPSLALGACALLALLGCSEERAVEQPEPVYEGDVAVLLEARCGECHGGDEDAGAGYRIDSYARALRCPEGSPDLPATGSTREDGAPLIDVLERPSHSGLLDDAERARLARWLQGEAPRIASAVHAPGILNPRSEDWHGRLAATDGFAPLTEREHTLTCGRCHDGAPATPPGVSSPAPGAPACTSCHREPEGALACGTCHGDGARRAYPPRDRCAFEGPEHDAHRAHVTQGALRAEPLACTACHPTADRELSGTHADGTIDVRLDPKLAGDGASYDAASGSCSVSCHARDGARPTPRFDQAGPLSCGDCHGAPPADHFAGACDDCHPGASARGAALDDASLHLNGTVDLHKGGGEPCAACHGQDDDPMPRTGAHLAHARTALTAPIECDECHKVPRDVLDEGHLDRGAATAADIAFGARARERNHTPSYEGGSCRDVACHGAGLFDAPELVRWNGNAITNCTSCHGVPPGGDHPESTSCAATLCHGSAVTASTPPALTPAGRARHIDGTIDVQPR